MADTPTFKTPLGSQEQPIYDKLLAIRETLVVLKSDRSNYVKSQDVQEYYGRIIAQVEALDKIRTQQPNTELNQVDRVLDDCFQLISLFFMTIGRNAEAPAAYSLVSTIQRLLDHLKEAGFFASEDLTGLSLRLEQIEDSVRRGKESYCSAILSLLDTRIAACRITLGECQNLLSHLSPELKVVHTKLVSILRSLSGLNAKSKFDLNGIKEYQAQLKQIAHDLHADSLDNDGTLSATEAINRYADKVKDYQQKFPTDVQGSEVVHDLLERCFLWSDIIIERNGKMQDRFLDKLNELKGIRDQLEKLSLTQAWSLRETDLYSFQRRLIRIDDSRENGDFLDAQGKPADLYEQRTMLYLVRKCYALIYYMMTSSEPVSEALLPVYNQLMTLKKCLIQVKKSGGVSSPRELYPYSMKLNSIDNMRQDGKFVINGDIPEGQGSVTGLLSECFELAYELRNDAEDNKPDSDDDDDDDDKDAAEEPKKENEADEKLLQSIGGGVGGMSIGVSS